MGQKSGNHTVGAQGSLAHRRKELQEAELRATLEAAQTNEAQRIAQEGTPECMRQLMRIIRSKKTSDGARLAAIRLNLETAWGKPSAREASDGGVRRKGAGGRNVVVNIRAYGSGISKQVSAPVLASIAVPTEDAMDAEFADEPDL